MKPVGKDPLLIQPKTVQPLHPAKAANKKLSQKAQQAAEQFETMMALQMVRGMQSSLEGGNIFGAGQAADIYSGLTEWELARMISRDGHLGLKEQILRQLPKEEEHGR